MTNDLKNISPDLTEKELKPLLEEVQKDPSVGKLVEEAPELAEEQKAEKALQEKKSRIYLSGKLFKGGLGEEGKSKIGVTRKNKKLSKRSEKISKNSRKKNRK